MQHRELVLVERGCKLALNADCKLPDVFVDLAILCSEAESGVWSIFLVDIAPDETAADQEPDRPSEIEGIR